MIVVKNGLAGYAQRSFMATSKEDSFAELIKDYESLWVALIDKGGEEIVVASGKTPSEALSQAAARGFSNAVLFSVPSFSEAFVY